MEKMNLLNNKKFVILTFIILIPIVAAVYFNCIIQKPFKNTSDKEIEIKKGDNIYSIINRLDGEKLVKNIYVVKMYIKNKHITEEIKPGYYRIYSGASLEQFISNLIKGNFDNKLVKVTIPEGYDIKQIAALFEEKGIIRKDDFLKACKEYKVPNYIKADNKRDYMLEGYLFPDTYQFKKDSKGEDIISAMLKRFEQVLEKIKNKDGIKVESQNIDSIINMASIIEREAERDDERNLISSVFYNRLKINMKLQSCATVLYALGKHKEKLYLKDLEVKSLYNTYSVNGLPVGPICNPGEKSIIAAVHPADTKNLYFVSKNDGSHFFTDDYNKFENEKKVTQGF